MHRQARKATDDRASCGTTDGSIESNFADRVARHPAYWPAPFSAIVCGDPVALWVMVTVAVNVPFAVGWKCPWIKQLAPPARFVPQLLMIGKDEAPAPVPLMPVIERVDCPLLVSVICCGALDVPIVTFPKGQYPRQSRWNSRLIRKQLRAHPTNVGI